MEWLDARMRFRETAERLTLFKFLFRFTPRD